MGIRKTSQRFLQKLGIDYEVEVDDWFACFPDNFTITVPKRLPDYNERERDTHKFFKNLGLDVRHPLTYSLLHEAGHALSFSAGRGVSVAERDEYFINAQLLQDLVDNDQIDNYQGMVRYYDLQIEKDANKEAVKIFQKHKKMIKKFDKKLCKKMPIKRV